MRTRLMTDGLRISALALVLLVVWFLLSAPAPSSDHKPTPTPKPDPEDAFQLHMKTILFWNRFFTKKHFGLGVGHKLFSDWDCPETRCFAADHQDGDALPLAVEDFDIVIFHGAELDRNDVPRIRKPHQRYVFWLHESAAAYPQPLEPWNGFFNMTASFRRDSDIFMPYGWVAPKDAPRNAVPGRRPTWRRPPNVTAPFVARRERRLAAWLASNCVNSPSNRDELVLDLARHAQVDVLGACGRPCFQDECDRDRLAAHYDFFLALENSLCHDYVTEKLFLSLSTDLVPVVLGGADYSLVAPPGSYVNAADFASPRLLAEHLQALQADRQAYERHFWWKADYEVRFGIEQVMCQMCALLHNATLAPRVIEDLHSWWHDAVCAFPAAQLSTWLARARLHPGFVASFAFHHTKRRLASASCVLVFILTAVLVTLGFVLVGKWLAANRAALPEVDADSRPLI